MEDIALTLDAMLRDLLSNDELDQFLRDRGSGDVSTEPLRLALAPVTAGSGSQR